MQSNRLNRWGAFVLTLFLVECGFSCAATKSSNTIALCTSCSNLNVIIASSSLDQPVVQTQGVNPVTGCRTVTIFCAGTTTTSDVIVLWSLNNQDNGSSTDGAATGNITRTLTCNANGQLELSDNGFTGLVDTIECLSS